MIINGPGRISIVVGGKVVGLVENAKLHIAEAEPSTRELSDPWCPPDISEKWDLSAQAIIRDQGDVLREVMGDGTVDVTMQQPIGHLPRKMKKAQRAIYRRNTKWKRKLAAYVHRRSLHIRRAEMVVTPDQFDTLRATITGGTID